MFNNVGYGYFAEACRQKTFNLFDIKYGKNRVLQTLKEVLKVAYFDTSNFFVQTMFSVNSMILSFSEWRAFTLVMNVSSKNIG